MDDVRYQPEIETTLSYEFENTVKDTTFYLFFDHFIGRGTPLVLREWWDAVHQSLGRGGRQTFVTQGGVEDELLSRLVPVLNCTHRLSRIIFQLLHVSLCVDSISLLSFSFH